MYKGVILSVLASVTFGVLYFYAQLLQPFNSEETFAWRMLATIPFVTLFMWWMKDLVHIKEIYQRIFKQPWFIFWLIFSSFLCTTQLWLFLWGPINGRGLQVSLGYFLLPLVMVLVGSVLYKEKLSKWQIAAIVLAVIGVGHEFWRLGSVAWETAYVALAYPLYFFLRRVLKTDNLGGFWWDLLLVLPVAIYLAFMHSDTISLMGSYPHLVWAVLGLGLLSALGLGSYILASRCLPFVIFGLLSYLEPVLLAFASMVMGERVSSDEWLTYFPIWCAVLLLVVEGVIHLYKQKNKKDEFEQKAEQLQKRLDQDSK